MINCWFKSIKAAKPVKEDVILADANVETKEDKHKPFSRLWVPSGPAATCVTNTYNGGIPKHDKADDSVC